tara:strand:- start:15 stop:740 length:726 start_codon:yes stop_codon:yes gene_type:complete
MHQYKCPSCRAVLPKEQINVSKAVAHCLGCGKLSSLGDVMDFQEVQEQVQDTPSGCFVWEEGSRIRVQATLRSISGAIGALFISLFWNGIVSVFVVIAIAGLWSNLVGPLPEWFPAPDMEDGKGLPLGMALFLCLFLTPFVLIGSCMIAGIFLNLWGKVEVILDGPQGSVRTSVGPLGWTRRFDATSVDKVSIGRSSVETNGKRAKLIRIEADRTIKFGGQLNDKRLEWMRSVLKKLLVTQ